MPSTTLSQIALLLAVTFGVQLGAAELLPHTGPIPSGQYGIATDTVMKNTSVEAGATVEFAVQNGRTFSIEPSFSAVGFFEVECVAAIPPEFKSMQTLETALVEFYSSIDAAATAAVYSCWKKSLDEQREYGGCIYSLAPGLYGFTIAQGSASKVEQIPGPPVGGTLVGVWHTHWGNDQKSLSWGEGDLTYIVYNQHLTHYLGHRSSVGTTNVSILRSKVSGMLTYEHPVGPTTIAGCASWYDPNQVKHFVVSPIDGGLLTVNLMDPKAYFSGVIGVVKFSTTWNQSQGWSFSIGGGPWSIDTKSNIGFRMGGGTGVYGSVALKVNVVELYQQIAKNGPGGFANLKDYFRIDGRVGAGGGVEINGLGLAGHGGIQVNPTGGLLKD